MTKLELAQQLMIECAISGTMTTTVNQTGEFARVVDWIDAAWQEIQSFHADWDWLRSSNLLGEGASFATVSGTAFHSLGTGSGTCEVTFAQFGMWDRYSFRCYTTTVGTNDETFLDPISYDYWRDAYQYGAQRQVITRPVAVAIGPGKQVCLGPSPTGLYTVTGDYFRAPTAMTANDDVPTGLPAQYHMGIVYRAMTKYGFYESAAEVIQRGDREYKTLFAPLEAAYTPEYTTAGALA